MTGETGQGRGDAEALRLYQACLDALARAVMALDMDGVSALYNLPVQVRTLTNQMVIETEEDLRTGYRGYAENLIGMGTTDLLWLASTARWLSPSYIEGFHVTHVLSRARPLLEPFHSRMVLREVGGVWKIDELDVQLTNTHWPIELPRARGGRPLDEDRFDFAKGDARRTVTDPLAVYTRFLQEFSARNMAHDFDGWAAMHLFPHSIHTDSVDKTIKSPEGIRGFFDMISGLIREHGCDRFERAPSRAEFLSANQICGYHTGTLYAGDRAVIGPIKSRMILQRVGPTWFLRSVTNAVTNHDFPYLVPQSSDTLPRLLDIQDRKRT